MKTILTYANLVNSLVSKLANMQDAGIIDTFIAKMNYNTWEESIFKEIDFEVSFPYNEELGTSKIVLYFEHGDYDEERVEKFNESLDILIQQKYDELKKSNDTFVKIVTYFNGIIK